MLNRKLLRLSGSENRDFLQGLITNDIAKIDDGLVYAAMLTPQGKLIADFFLSADGDDVVLDIDAEMAKPLMDRLKLYKLRADVEIEEDGRFVHFGFDTPPEDGFMDPRCDALGWRAYRVSPFAPTAPQLAAWDAKRVEHIVPQSGIELTSESYILEAGFERLGGVDFRKGCYVGQEVTARMKHKTELRKGLTQLRIEGVAGPGDEITANGRAIGTLHTRSGDRAIAYLRFDRAKAEMECGDAKLFWDRP